jgi:hypothetical protein
VPRRRSGSKGKVESGVGHAKKTPLKGQRFESLEQAQAYLDHWEQHWADTRIHGTTKRQVAVMFAEEKPLLRRWNLSLYQYGSAPCIGWLCESEAAPMGAARHGWPARGSMERAAGRLLDPKTSFARASSSGARPASDAEIGPATPLGTLELRRGRGGNRAFCRGMIRRTTPVRRIGRIVVP